VISRKGKVLISSRPHRVAYLVSHPIQYQAPLLRYIVAHSDIELTAFFLSDFSVRGYQDPGFNVAVEWDVPLLEGYASEVLPAWGDNQSLTPLRPFVHGLSRRLRPERFDALWMHGYAHQANLRAMLIAKRRGIKVLVRAESQLSAAGGSPRVRRVKEPVLRRLFGTVDGFLTIGSLNAGYYRHYGVPDDKLFSVPYAVDNAFFQNQSQLADPRREELRRELGLEPGRPIILFASKFIARKRAGDLLEAYLTLSPDGKQEPHPYLVFVGDGEQRTALEARAAATGWGSIRFLGFRNQMELPRYFDLCDLFVLPSEAEPWGLIVNEVMNAARPVIVTDQVGSAPDLVRDGDNGYLVPVGDIAALAGRLRDVLSDPDRARRMGQRSREIIDGWGYAEDLAGLKQALEATAGVR
jgi:glycosyltransferase involved in cell wall biosynthesis